MDNIIIDILIKEYEEENIDISYDDYVKEMSWRYKIIDNIMEEYYIMDNTFPMKNINNMKIVRAKLPNYFFKPTHNILKNGFINEFI